MKFFALQIPADDDPARLEETVIKIGEPGGAGGWIHWISVSGKPGSSIGEGGFDTEEEALADACGKLGSRSWRVLNSPERNDRP